MAGAIHWAVAKLLHERCGERSDLSQPIEFCWGLCHLVAYSATIWPGRNGYANQPLLPCLRRQSSSNLGARLPKIHGLITKRNMAGLEWLSVRPVPSFDAARIKALREGLNMSQSVLAKILNTSVSTVRKWELGDKCPSGPSLKLLDLLERKGLNSVL